MLAHLTHLHVENVQFTQYFWKSVKNDRLSGLYYQSLIDCGEDNRTLDHLFAQPWHLNLQRIRFRATDIRTLCLVSNGKEGNMTKSTFLCLPEPGLLLLT